MKWLISLCLLLASLSSFADQGEAAQARFEVWLKMIEKTLASNQSPTEVAEALLNDDNRIAAFNLQALGKIYTPQKNTFSKLVRQSFKELEDGIGEYDKWKKISKKSGQAQDKARAEEAKKEFAQMLVNEKWLPLSSDSRTGKIRQFLSDFTWESYLDDKEQVLKVLIQQLEKLERTKYDLTRLEKTDGDGNGLHEFRREIRWFMIEARVLNGLVLFKPGKACSVPEYKGLLENADLVNNRYSVLPASSLEKDPCHIEQCQFLGLVQAVSQLGAMKDAAEQDKAARDSDQVRSEDLPKAKALAGLLAKTRVFSGLSKNIHSCLK